MPFTAIRSIIGAALLTVSLVSPVLSAPVASSTVNGIDIVVDTADRGIIVATQSGFEVEANAHRLIYDGETLRLDDRAIPMTGRPRELLINADGWQIEVVADGRPLLVLTELEGLHAAARRGHANALNTLGVRYLRGRGVPPDPEKAIEYYRLAAEQGLPTAQSNLAHIYWTGEYVERDPAEAVRLARMAAEKGNMQAMSLLGLAQVRGVGTSKNLAEGVGWMHKAAEMGSLTAMNDLGIRYTRGEGVPEDHAKAAEWYRKAADLGLAEAKSNLAFAHLEGRGVPRDPDRAEALFAEAAAEGNQLAQERLARLRTGGGGAGTDGNVGVSGRGTPVDPASVANDQPPAKADGTLPPDDLEAFLAIDGRQQGPFDAAALRELATDGNLTSETLVWMEGMADWHKAGDVAEIMAAIGATGATGSGETSVTGLQLFAMIDGARHGPLGMEEIAELVREKRIIPETLVWKNGMADWEAAATLPELAPVLGTGR